MKIRKPGGGSPPSEGPTHQNVKLSRGRHRSAAEGACVVEMASMLSGEPFSDHPRSVCPVVASYMRALNDRLDDSARQELLRYAAEIVDTRASRRVRRARLRACARWAHEMGALSGLRRWTMAFWGGPRALAALCARAAIASAEGDAAFVLADVLIAIGRPAGEQVIEPPPSPPERVGVSSRMS